MPLVVLMHGIPFGDPFPGWPAAKMEAIMHDLQEDLATLVPNAHFAIATESGHNIHQDQPDLVIEAIRDVVDAIHDPSTWTSQAEAPIATSGDFAGLVDIGGRCSTWSATARAAPPSCWWPATARPAATGPTICSTRMRRGRWSCPAWPSPPASVPTTAQEPIASIGEDDFLSRSDPIAQPRTSTEVVAELHALLQAAEIPGPYVLAGHSLGGFFARLYASTYPDEVVGIVLVDAYSELLESVMPPERWQALVRLNQGLGTDTVVPIPGYGDARDDRLRRGQRGDARGGGGLAAAADAAGHRSPMASRSRYRRMHKGSPPRSSKGTFARRTRRRPPSSRTRASPWPPRAATTSTRINPSW